MPALFYWKFNVYGSKRTVKRRLQRKRAEGCLTSEEFNKAKETLRKAYVPMQDLCISVSPTVSFDCCKPAQSTDQSASEKWAALYHYVKEENNMRDYYETTKTCAKSAAVSIHADPEFSKEKHSQDYLIGRLNEATCTKRTELNKTYNLHASRVPDTLGELLQLIKDNKYTLNTEKYSEKAILGTSDDDNIDLDEYGNDGPGFSTTFSPFRYVDFKMDKTPDLDGYAKASKLMEDAAEKVRDTINVGEAADGLKALYDFEAQSFTVN